MRPPSLHLAAAPRPLAPARAWPPLTVSVDLRGAQIKTQKKERKKKPKHKGNTPTSAQVVAISTAQPSRLACSLDSDIASSSHFVVVCIPSCASFPRPQDATEHGHGIYGMHSKLGGSYPVPEKLLQMNAADIAKETEKAEKTVGSKSEPERKMGNKAAATTDQAMAKHVFPAKVAKKATPAGSSLVARIWPDLARIWASLAHLPSLAHIWPASELAAPRSNLAGPRSSLARPCSDPEARSRS